MAAKCTEVIANNNQGMISLGAYGGYVTFHFDHSIANISGQRDFYLRGNSVQTAMFPAAYGGASEPGIVMVSKDVNHNGLPDDPWYEISGSADVDSVGKVIYDYEITYQPNPMGSIPWTDNKGGSGVVRRMDAYHQQEYYPQWIEDNLTFKGTRLPQNACWMEQGKYKKAWVLMFLRYGYADNQPNDSTEACSIDIGWAVDENQQPVHLDFIDFVRIYNGMNQSVGDLGETSTEVAGAHDLHLEASIAAIKAATAGIVSIGKDNGHTVARYSPGGQRLTSPRRGLNIVRMSDGTTRKIMIK